MSRKRSHLPSSVQAIKDAIDRHEAGSSTTTNTDPSPQDPPADPPQDAPQPDQVPTPSQPTPVEPSQPSSLEIQLAEAKAERERWEHKFNVTRGRLDAANAEIAELRDDVTRLTAQLSTRQAQPAESSPQFPRDEAAEDLLGADTVAAIDRRVDEIVKRAVAPVAAATQQTAQERFIAKVSEQVADWNEVQSSDEFQSYMNQVHPETGRLRGEHLMEAVRNGDVDRVVTIYKNAKAALGIGSTATRPATTPPPVKPLADRVVPTGAGAASTPSPGTPKRFTRAELTAGYTEIAQIKARGQWHGKTREKWEAWERDAIQASNEGRVSA